MKRLAYQGVEGSYSHMTALRLFGSSYHYIGLPQFADVFELVESGKADAALLAIENTLIGNIHEVLDLLGESDLQVNGETRTRIEHCLITMPECELEQIKTVYSHPKALGQCQKFFRLHPNIEIKEYHDTAAAAALVAKRKDPSIGAIASRVAAELHHLKVLKMNIEDNKENFTRFFLLSKEESAGPKAMVRLILEHKVGALASILSLIAKDGANVVFIVSRPLIGRPFEYAFYLEIEHLSKALLAELRAQAKSFRIMGHYNILHSLNSL